MSPTRRGRLGACLGSLALLAACSADPAPDRKAAERRPAELVAAEPSTVERDMPDSSLPGEEALSPPPPDPRAPGVLEQLAALPTGRLVGALELTVSGLVAFAEPVTGRCTADGGTRSFAMSLSDGSSLTIELGPDGGVSRLTAPGVDVRQTLSGTDIAVSDGVQLSADLLTAGTSEPSGRLSLEGTCS